MAFGIGINMERPEQEPIRGEVKDVAVKCWFTATGKAMPLMMKVQTEEEEIIKVDDIHVLTVDKQWYADIMNVKYRCQALVRGQMMEFVLLFCPEECSWRLILTGR